MQRLTFIFSRSYPAVLLLGLLLLVCTGGFMAGCAQNTVPLVYQSPSQNTLPAAGTPTVCVVTFTDKRDTMAIGKRSDGTEFMPESDVGSWFTQALGTEIARKGLVVTQAATEASARASGAAFIVFGSVDEVWMTESNATEYSIRMRGTLVMKSSSQTLINQSYSTSLSRRVVPGPSVPRQLFSESVGDIAEPMAKAVLEKAHR